MRSLFALEIAEGARDWRGTPDGGGGCDEFELRAAGTWPPTRLDIHHMWARGVKKPPKTQQRIDGVELPYGEQAYEAVINRCLLLKETNIAVGNTPFSAVSELIGVRREWMGTYLIDPGAGSWFEFVRDRLEQVQRALQNRIPGRA